MDCEPQGLSLAQGHQHKIAPGELGVVLAAEERLRQLSDYPKLLVRVSAAVVCAKGMIRAGIPISATIVAGALGYT